MTLPPSSIRQRKSLRRHAAGKPIKARELAEFIELGWIEYIDGPLPGGGHVTCYRLSKAGAAVIGRTIPEGQP